MIGKPHILSVNDVQRGIQALAAFLLGDASKWTELVSVNQLSPPYMTTNPGAVYGPPVATLALNSELPAGSTSLSLPNQPQGINVIYLSAAGNAQLVAESVNVESYNGQTLTLSTPTQNAYPSGARLQLFDAYNEGSIRVLLPGDTILIPVESNGSLTFGGSGQLIDTFGSDMAAYPPSFANGDFATVQGLDTLQQRMRAVIQTSVRSLPLYPTWGSRLPSSVGEPTNSVRWVAYLRQALLLLPEVSDVQNTSIAVTGSQVSVSATVYTHASNDAIQLYNENFII
ncbi:hypothetical protein ACOJUR_12055 [Alicyclobacillus tolerans]|uniref:hypothetical protein n=1 Tax=Alicyclobacillus tolerans TaxID=90970 RepID=UPI003B7D899E